MVSSEWIDKGYHEEWTFECSACGGWSPEEYDFCPHCGADMQLTASNEKKHQTYTEEPVKLTYDGVVIRADAIDALFRKAHTKPAVTEGGEIHRYLDCYEAMDVIKALPSAVVEPTAREFLTDWAIVCHHYDKAPCETCPLYGICGPAMIQNIDDAISSVKSAVRLVQEHKYN